MSLTLDHIVIAVRDLDAAIADYTALGFTVLRGGEHPGRPTHNALVVFADGAYFELIAWRAPAPQDRWWRQLAEHGEGLVDFALLPPDTGATVAAAAARGLALEGPLDGGRLRPDGERLHWQTARPPSPELPFLCGDLTPRALRVPEGAARAHANGVRGVARVAVAVPDLAASLAHYRALLGDGTALTVVPGAPGSAPDDGVRRATLTLGGSTVVLEAPAAAGEQGADTPGAQALRRRLATRGPGPHAVELLVGLAPEAARAAPLLPHGISLIHAG